MYTAIAQFILYSLTFFADLENWNGTDRHHFDAKVSDQDLMEVLYEGRFYKGTTLIRKPVF